MTKDEAKRQEILDAAGRVFAQYGLRKTTVGDVVREAGVARATVYKHFPGKDELFRAVIERELEEILEADAEAMKAEKGARAKLHAFILKHLEMLRRKVNAYRLTVSALNDIYAESEPHAHELFQRALMMVREVLVEGMEQGEIARRDPDATTLAFLIAHKGLFLGALTGYFDREAETQIVDSLHALLFEGLLARGEAA